MGERTRGAIAIVLLLALATPAASDPAASGAAASPPVPAAEVTVSGAPWALATPAAAFGEEPPARPEPPRMGSALGSASGLVEDQGLLAQRGMGTRSDRPKQPKESKPEPPAGEPKSSQPADSLAPVRRHAGLPHVLSGQRARIMLQSLTVPGWGEATLGQKHSAIAFGLLEAGIWGSFTAFRIQERMRRDTYERTASLYAGIDLSRRDEEYRRVVGFYISSDEYNQLVVRRNAANLYFGDPAAYDAYIAEHELKGDQAWSWDSEASLLRYRAERQATQRAINRAHNALAAALISRLVSMIHASAGAIRRDAAQTSLKLEYRPDAADPSAFHLGLRADF